MRGSYIRNSGDKGVERAKERWDHSRQELSREKWRNGENGDTLNGEGKEGRLHWEREKKDK